MYANTFNHRKIDTFFKRNKKLELPERYEYYLMILKEMVHLKPGRLFGVVLAVFEVAFPDLETFFGKMKSRVKKYLESKPQCYSDSLKLLSVLHSKLKFEW
jgi:hypothetical protein